MLAIDLCVSLKLPFEAICIVALIENELSFLDYALFLINPFRVQIIKHVGIQPCLFPSDFRLDPLVSFIQVVKIVAIKSLNAGAITLADNFNVIHFPRTHYGIARRSTTV
jgi:hypothetical protein